jgi:hypothetical protein
MLLEEMEFRDDGEDGFDIKGEHSLYHISPGGCVGIDTSHPMDSPENINAYLEGVDVFMAVNPDRQDVTCNGKTPERKLLSEMCAELNGLTIKNPSEQSLEDVNPDLAQKVRDAFEARQENKGFKVRQETENKQDQIEVKTWDQVERSPERLQENMTDIVVNGGDSNLTGVQKVAGEGLGVVARVGNEPMAPVVPEVIKPQEATQTMTGLDA